MRKTVGMSDQIIKKSYYDKTTKSTSNRIYGAILMERTS